MLRVDSLWESLCPATIRGKFIREDTGKGCRTRIQSDIEIRGSVPFMLRYGVDADISRSGTPPSRRLKPKIGLVPCGRLRVGTIGTLLFPYFLEIK